jgi:hypothetical protein
MEQANSEGMQSFIDPGRKENGLWSMAFESLKPGWLARDHRRMVQELYGERLKLADAKR